MSGVVSFTLALPDERATAALAARLAGLAEAGDVIALAGPLGSGKTTFARAFIRARCPGVAEVPSPTFTLVEIYGDAAPAIWHFDLFRLDHPDEAWELGIEEAFAGGISLIEWPERLGAPLPRERLDLTLAFGDGPSARMAVVAAASNWARRLAGFAHE